MINTDQAKLLVWFDYTEKLKQIDLILQNAALHNAQRGFNYYGY